VRGDEKAEAHLAARILEHGAILDTRQPRRFEIRHAAAGVRVAYAIERDEQPPRGWTVREVARSPYAEPASAGTRAAAALAFSEIALRKLGSISLAGDAASAEGSPIRAVSDFAIDDRGRFGFLRATDVEAPPRRRS
jgi:hypothetical protein